MKDYQTISLDIAEDVAILRLNRPDLVARRLGRASSGVLELYERAWARRVRRMGFTPGQLAADGGLPTLTILGRESLPVSQAERQLTLRVRASARSGSGCLRHRGRIELGCNGGGGGHVRTLPLPPTISEGEGGVHFARELRSNVYPTLPLRNRGG